jgi:DDE superfamily endonuclease
VEAVAVLTTNGRKVLLIYDGYRSHLGLEVLKTLMNCSVLAYALPAHTSGTTQPLDVGIFSPFKQALNKHTHCLSATTGYAPFDVFDFAKMMSAAFDDAFTIQNIKSAFRKTGLWPLNSERLLSMPLPMDRQNRSTIVSVTDMQVMLDEKRKKLREGMCIQPAVIKRGFVDTSAGLELTQPDVMRLVEARENTERVKYLAAASKAVAKEKTVEQNREKQRQATVAWNSRLLERRSQLFGIPLDFLIAKPVRSMALRRKVTVPRTIACRAVATQTKGTYVLECSGMGVQAD